MIAAGAFSASERRFIARVQIWPRREDAAFRTYSRRERTKTMIYGAHMIVYSKDADADRAFFRDILGWASVDAGHGWLIFALPPAEAAVHPSDDGNLHELYAMCEDLKSAKATLAEKGVTCSDVQEAPCGSITRIRLPAD